MKTLIAVDVPDTCNKCIFKQTSFAYTGQMMCGCKLYPYRYNKVFAPRPDWCRLVDKPSWLRAIPVNHINRFIDKTTGTKMGDDITNLDDYLKGFIQLTYMMIYEFEKEIGDKIWYKTQ